MRDTPATVEEGPRGLARDVDEGLSLAPLQRGTTPLTGELFSVLTLNIDAV